MSKSKQLFRYTYLVRKRYQSYSTPIEDELYYLVISCEKFDTYEAERKAKNMVEKDIHTSYKAALELRAVEEIWT